MKIVFFFGGTVYVALKFEEKKWRVGGPILLDVGWNAVDNGGL